MKPIIGITARYMKGDDGRKKYFVNRYYCDKLSRLGAIPFMLVPQDEQDLDVLLQQVDGVLIPGGEDADPKYFNEEVHPTCTVVDPMIDEMDLHVINACLKNNVPLLGICRGHQMINIALGGSLYQDIPSQYPNAISHSQEFAEIHPPHHLIYTTEGSLIQQLVGKEYPVNSFHHQSLKDIGKGLTVTATSSDGIVEAIEGDNILAFQFHPEMMHNEQSDALFTHWINSCRL